MTPEERDELVLLLADYDRYGDTIGSEAIARLIELAVKDLDLT